MLRLARLPDYNGAVDFELIERGSHGVNRGLIGGLLVALAHQFESRECGSFGHARRFDGKITIEVGHRSP